jgi:hypothetical protein
MNPILSALVFCIFYLVLIATSGFAATPGLVIDINAVEPGSSPVSPLFAVNGVCGSANGVGYTMVPTANLCSIGSPTTVTGIGPWFWSCSGINGGSATSCSAAQAGGVVFRSTDSGLTWTPTKTGAGLNTEAKPLLVSPTYASDRTLFLGADGVFKSTDSGDTWTRVLSSGAKCKDFAVSPSYSIDRTIFAGEYLTGIYKSVDGGNTWTTSNTGLSPSMVFSLAISPAFTSDHTIFSGVYGAGVFKSIDSGATWSVSNTGMGAVSPLSLAISPAFASDRTIFAATTDGQYGNGGPHYHIYKSTDGGTNWAPSDTRISGAISVLKISPGYASDQTLFAVTSSGVYKSTDRGANWTQVSNGSFSALALSPTYAGDQTLFAGAYGVNIFNSSNGGSSWNASSSDFLTKYQLASLEVSPVYSSDHTAFTVVSLAAPMMNVTPSALSFAPVYPNSSSLPKQVTITNGMAGLMGTGNLAITGMALSGAGAGDFSLAPGSCVSLKPTVTGGGSQCSFEVTFTPKSSGSKSATLTITPYDVFNSPRTITLSGTGITRGVCGSDNGQTLAQVAPAALCTEGTASLVSVSGHPWSWRCQGDAGTDPVDCSATIQTYALSASITPDSGTGDIQADLPSNDDPPVSLFCPASICSALFDYGRTVRLTAIPDSISLFASWGGDCTEAHCDLVMTAPRAVTARFTRARSFKNVTLDILDDSLAALLTASNADDEIRMLTAEMAIDSLTLDKKLTLSGGWKGSYLEQDINPTTLTGTITVQDADSSISDTAIKGGLFIQSGSLKVRKVQVISTSAD